MKDNEINAELRFTTGRAHFPMAGIVLARYQSKFTDLQALDSYLISP